MRIGSRAKKTFCLNLHLKHRKYRHNRPQGQTGRTTHCLCCLSLKLDFQDKGQVIKYAHFEVGGDERSQRSSIWKSAIVRENCGGVEYYRMHKLQGPGNCAGSEKSVETDELDVIHVGCYVFVEFHEQQNFLRHFIHFRISKH